MDPTCTKCEAKIIHEDPCDAFGYNGRCSICTEFVHRNDGTLIHDNGTVFAPVIEYQETYYEIQPALKPRKAVEVKLRR